MLVQEPPKPADLPKPIAIPESIIIPSEKTWYNSKTLWANAVMLAAMVAQQATGKDLLTPEVQASVIVVINAVLRLLTKDRVTWK